jgi:hypothetical protein
MLEMFLSPNVDMFPKAKGVENTVLIAIISSQNI